MFRIIKIKHEESKDIDEILKWIEYEDENMLKMYDGSLLGEIYIDDFRIEIIFDLKLWQEKHKLLVR